MNEDGIFVRVHYKDGQVDRWHETRNWQVDVKDLLAKGFIVLDVKESTGRILWKKGQSINK